MVKAKFFFGCLFLLALPKLAIAYPSFVSHGYTSCGSCHFNPFGNGPLTDYGRGAYATAIAAPPPFLPELSDEVLAEHSGFAGVHRLPSWLRLAAGYRGLFFYRKAPAQEAQSEYIHMDVNGSVILLPTAKISVVATGAYIPIRSNPRQGGAPQDSHFISREHYAGYRFAKELGVYLGMMDKVYGLRIQDHEAFSRKKTELAMNDQAHGIVAHIVKGDYEGGLNVFAGNLYQATNLRQAGLSARLEHLVGLSTKLGASLLYSAGSYRSRTLGAMHVTSNFSNDRGLLAEMGLIGNHPIGADTQTGGYAYVQGIQNLMRGLQMSLTGEYYSVRTFGPEPRNYLLGIGMQYFPQQRFELQSDIRHRWVTGVGKARGSTSLEFLAQMHVSF